MRWKARSRSSTATSLRSTRETWMRIWPTRASTWSLSCRVESSSGAASRWAIHPGVVDGVPGRRVGVRRPGLRRGRGGDRGRVHGYPNRSHEHAKRHDSANREAGHAPLRIDPADQGRGGCLGARLSRPVRDADAARARDVTRQRQGTTSLRGGLGRPLVARAESPCSHPTAWPGRLRTVSPSPWNGWSDILDALRTILARE